MTTPLVCLLSRPAGAPADDTRIHYQDPALTAAEQAAILAWSDYPDEPPGGDQDGQPLAIFRYAPLPSGRLALSRLQRLSGAPDEPSSEVLVHTLVFEPDQLLVYPLDYQDWEGWCADPTGLSSTPPALSTRGPQLEAARTFLAARPAREQAAVLLLTGLLCGDRHGRAMLVRDLAERGLPWMACIQRLLPLSHALPLSLSSHEHQDRQPGPRLAATAPGSELDYRQVQQGESFFIVDLLDHQRSTLPRHDPLVHTARACATQLVTWLLEQPEQLREFHDFVAALFHHEALTPELWWMLRLYQASTNNGTGLAAGEVEPVLDILGYYTRPAAWEGMVGLLDGLLPQLTQERRFSNDDALLGLFMEALEHSGQPEPQRRAQTQWLSLFDHYLLAGEHLETILERYRQVASLSLCAELHQQLLEPARLARVQSHAAALEADALGTVTWLLLDSALQLDQTLDAQRSWLDPLLARLLAQPGGDAQLDWLLIRAAETTPMAALLQRAWASTGTLDSNARSAQTTLARLLHTRLQDHHDAMALRRALLANHDTALLMAEWRYQLSTTQEPRALFQHYRQQVLDVLPDYRDRCFGAVCEALFQVLSDTARAEQARDWLLGSEEDWWRLPDELTSRCVALSNRQLSLRDRSAASRRLTAQVFARATELGQSLQPDIPQLRRSLDYAAHDALQGDDDWFQETRQALEGLGAEDYRWFLNGVLGTLLRQALSPDRHGKILAYLDNGSGSLDSCYLTALEQLLARQDPLAAEVALRFWMTDEAIAGPRSNAARTCLLRGLSGWSNANLAALGQILERQEPTRWGSTPRWRDFWRELDGYRQQRLGTLGRQLRTAVTRLVQHRP